MSYTCSECGANINPNVFGTKYPCSITEEDQTVFVCSECLAKIGEKWKTRKSCDRCAYFSVDALVQKAHCKKIDLHLEPSILVKDCVMGNLIAVRFISDAEKCVHYTSKEEYKEKALKGQIETKKETHYVVCSYCSAHYDANQHIECPHCGAHK